MKFLLGIIAVLVLLCSFLGYKTYDLGGEKATLGVALESFKEALQSSKKALETKDSSCKQDDASIVELDSEKSIITDKAESITQELNKLPSKPKDKNNVIQKDVYLPDDGLLNPELVGLLKQSYCNTEPTDNICRPNGQPVNPSL